VSKFQAADQHPVTHSGNQWNSIPFEEAIEKITYTNRIQRSEFLADGSYPIVSQEEGLINGYWNQPADVFKTTRPLTVFGDHTQTLKYIDFDFVLGADGVKILQSKSFLLPKFFHYQLQGLTLKNLGYARHYRLLKEKQVVYPSQPEQERIVAVLDEAFEGVATVRANEKRKLESARALFRSFLQSLFSKNESEWAQRRIGDHSLLEIVDGDRGKNYPSSGDFMDEGYCLFLSTKNVRPDGFKFDSTAFISLEKDAALRKGKLQRGDVVMTTRGTIGNIALYSEDVEYPNIRINSGMLIFRANRALILPAFLFELLRSDIVREQILRNTSGAAQPQLPIKTLVNFRLPMPDSLTEQRSIVLRARELEQEVARLEAVGEQKLTDLNDLELSILNQAFSGNL
jgi:type I restriction enzyme S subunit